MQPVANKQLWVAPDAGHHERNQRHAIMRRQLRIDRIKRLFVSLPPIIARDHDSEHNLRPIPTKSDDHFLEIFPRRFRIEPAQHVVRAELDDGDVELFTPKRVIETLDAGRSRIAGYAGVDDNDIEAGRAQSPFELGRKGVAGGEAIACRKTVPENDDPFRIRRPGYGQRRIRSQYGKRSDNTDNEGLAQKAERAIRRRALSQPVSQALQGKFSVQNVIELAGVDLTLGEGPARVHVLKNISLAIRPGETVSLLGPSGSGKSTLLMTLAGLERPDAGAVRVGDCDLNALSEDALARFRGANIGVVFQSFQLIPTMTALENVAIPLELAGKPDAFARAQTELESVGLGDRLAHYPAQLSGGEQQRVALARALAPDPLILAADEPTGNLDSDTGAAVVELIFAQQRRRGATLVLVTHDPVLAARCGRQVRLRSGRIEADEAGARAS